MGKSKTSRKGKKEWRRNISNEEHQEFLQSSSKIERSGGNLDKAPDTSIFFVDRSKDAVVKRKVDRFRSRVLHCDKVLKRNSLVPAVHWPKRKKETPGSLAALPPSAKALKVALTTIETKQLVLGENKGDEVAEDLWAVSEPGQNRGEEPTAKKTKKWRAGINSEPATEKYKAQAAAVEVDVPGCSYNPTFQDHQDALGLAVAQQLKKVYEKELQPKAPPATVLIEDAEMYGLTEEDRFFIEAGMDGEEDEDEVEDKDNQVLFVPKPVRVKKLTQADLNRKMRRRAQEEEASSKAKIKKSRKDMERLNEIEEEIKEQKEEENTRHARREIARKEKQSILPPRLGPHRFQPEELKVLLSEEVSGSLRKLKGCATLAMERFKSFQRRGLLEPRIPVKHKQAKNRRLVDQGSLGRKEREMHNETQALKLSAKDSASLQVNL